MQLYRINLTVVFSATRHPRNEKGPGAEMRPAIVCGIVTGGRAVQLLATFFLALVTVPEVFAKENSVQLWVTSFTFCYMRG